jgi:hypothetical protein
MYVCAYYVRHVDGAAPTDLICGMRDLSEDLGASEAHQ